MNSIMMEPFDTLPLKKETRPKIDKKLLDSLIREKRKKEFLEISDPTYDQIEANRIRKKIDFLREQYNLEDKDFMDYLMINREDIDNVEAKNYQKSALLKSYLIKKKELNNEFLELILNVYTKIKNFALIMFVISSIFIFCASLNNEIDILYIILPIVGFLVFFALPDSYNLRSIVKLFIELNDTKDKISKLNQ